MKKSKFDKVFKMIMEDIKDPDSSIYWMKKISNRDKSLDNNLRLLPNFANILVIFEAIFNGRTNECIEANKDNILPDNVVNDFYGYKNEFSVIDPRLKPTNNALEFICQRLFECSEYIKNENLHYNITINDIPDYDIELYESRYFENFGLLYFITVLLEQKIEWDDYDLPDIDNVSDVDEAYNEITSPRYEADEDYEDGRCIRRDYVLSNEEQIYEDCVYVFKVLFKTYKDVAEQMWNIANSFSTACNISLPERRVITKKEFDLLCSNDVDSLIEKRCENYDDDDDYDYADYQDDWLFHNGDEGAD